MKRLAFILLIFFVSAAEVKPADKPDIPPGRLCQGKVQIQGRSNVGGFSLALDLDEKNDFICHNGDEEIAFFSRDLQLQLSDFQSRNQHMKDDFLELLKASKYPYIYITFIVDPLVSGDQISKSLTAIITIAGISRMYRIDCRNLDLNGSELHIDGEKKLSIRDFNLVPPSKLKGMVRVDEVVDIQFSITFMLEEQEHHSSEI